MLYIWKFIIFNEKINISKIYQRYNIFFYINVFSGRAYCMDPSAVNYFDYVVQDGHGLKTYFFFIFY